jgi:trimethylamine--corrinoid protein Co-methyltransferase
MRPALQLLEAGQLQRILDEALALLREPGVRVEAPGAREALARQGAALRGDVASIPERLIRESLASVPPSFQLYRRSGVTAVGYGEGRVHFDPGSCAVHVLDPDKLDHRPTQSGDLARLVRLAEALPEYAAQSTAAVCHDVPEPIGDVYRLFLVLLHADKPIVTGAFTPDGVGPMVDLLRIDAGGEASLRARPRAIFDVCPSPPLRWSEFGARNLVDLALAGVPAQIVSMPLAGATAPVTLLGAVVQHAAECLSGVAIHQATAPGAPLVWGGAPAIFDMRAASAPVGAIETAMITLAYAQIGKHLGLPTHGYLGASDAKVVDAQAGMESGMSAVLGSLAGIDMLSGAGMLDSLACISLEKLVLDAEAIGMAQHLLAGLVARSETLATGAFTQAGLGGEFLKLAETRRLFREEQHLPSRVIERRSLRAWAEAGRSDAYARARERVEGLLAEARPTALEPETEAALRERVRGWAEPLGLRGLPGAPNPSSGPS